jgi:hypothetical protein
VSTGKHFCFLCGMNEPAILAALTAINQTLISEPLPDSKIKDIAKSHGKYEAEEITGKGITPAPPEIQFFKARELQSIELKEPSRVVPGSLPEGLCLLSARPQKGKTCFALNVSVAQSTGGSRKSLALIWNPAATGARQPPPEQGNPRRMPR